jgi:formylglycine-generating enzyme required for sulfatase activity
VAGLDAGRVPVEGVSWSDAVTFCERLSALPGERAARRVYRLPSEAEWEYACRAGTRTPFHTGKALSPKQANINGGLDSPGPYLGRTTSVGSYRPNAFGLYDMHGNVAEWCHDSFDRGYYARSPKKDPRGPRASRWVVSRGGWWGRFADNCRSAFRGGGHRWDRKSGFWGTGFRVASSPRG